MTGKVGSTAKPEPTYTMPNWPMNDDVVVSGVAGRFPESENVEEYAHNLYNHVDMITSDDRRWRKGLYGTPPGYGKLKDLEHFDAWFFGVHGRMTATMDPAQRILLEVAYEAIFDAGIDPLSLSGKNIGVYVASSGASIPDVQSEIDDVYNGYESLGNSPAMMANRTSYTFDVNGPSFTLDTGCSSSTYAINEALIAMRLGNCDAALVAGCCLLKFLQTVLLNTTSILSVDSRCKTYDKSANGFVRSEGIAAIYLQKKSDAKRCYATILNCRVNNDGRKVEGIMFPSAPHQKALIMSTYEQIKMNPRSIAFLEAHGTGNGTGDIQEGRCIEDVFCPDKDDQILVTSVKSNMGHTEAVSGIASLIKVILSFENGLIPANLHYKEPNPRMRALVDGRIKVPTENTPFHGGCAGISNFGFGGGNAHLIVKSFDKEKQVPTKGRRVPRLVTACGCTQQAVQFILDAVRQKEFSDEGIVLLEDACKTTPTKMRNRGYTLLGNEGPEPDVIQMCPGEPRPVWFLYSGMGSQWAGMGKQLMKLEPFAKSIRSSAEFLRPFGIDLIHLLCDATEEELNHIVYPFVTIAAVQIALTDLLKLLGLKPEGIVGHSVGELGCAYADGTFTPKQMLLAAYWRGESCAQTELIHGQMAAVGMTWEEAKARCPPGVFAVCHNAQDSVTISGPTEDMEKFIQQLKDENIFARAVKTGDIAFHCKYVEPASILMRKELKKVIPEPVARSPLWISSSIPEAEWNTPKAKFSSVDYHINNLLSPVLFNEAMTKVPKNALIIEIAPHCLLQPIVKRILGPESVYIGLCNKNKPDNLRNFLGAIGSMYNAGLNPEIKNLYDPVTFPVPRGTPMLNSLIKWDRTHWKTWNYSNSNQLKDMVTIDTVKGGPYEYIVDHKLDGRVMYTAPGYLWLAWKALSKYYLIDMEDLPVMFEDVQLHRAAVLPKSGVFTFNVKVRESDGTFNVVEAGSVVASGKITKIDDRTNYVEAKQQPTPGTKGGVHEEVFEIDGKSFYKELLLRGYEYSKSYLCISKCSSDGLSSSVQWKGNWVPFMESVFLLSMMHQPVRGLALVTRIGMVKIYPRWLPENVGDEMRVTFNPTMKHVISPAVEIQGLEAVKAPRRLLKQGKVALEERVFLPFIDNFALAPHEQSSLEEYKQVCATVVARAMQNTNKMAAVSSLFSGTKKASDALVRKYLDAKEVKHILLQAFHSLETNGAIPEISKYELSKDLISTASMSERAMRACLDCFLTNVGATKLNIVEISNNCVLYPAVDRSLKFTHYGHLITSYTLARTSREAIPSDLNPSANVVVLNSDNIVLPEGSDLVVAKDIFSTNSLNVEQTLNAVAKSLRDNHYFILSERIGFTPVEKCLMLLTKDNVREQNEAELEKAFVKAGLTLICKKSDGTSFVVYLLKKITPSSKKHQMILRVEDPSFKWIEELKVVMERDTQETVWIVDDRPNSGITGMMESLMKEVGGGKLRVYCNASLDVNQKAPAFEPSSSEVQKIVHLDLKFNCYRNGKWGMFVSQILPKEVDSEPSSFCHMNPVDRGDLNSLRWIQSTNQYSDENVKVIVAYSGLAHRDTIIANGKLPMVIEADGVSSTEGGMGLEFSGFECGTSRRVMGVVAAGGLANVLYSQKDLTFEVPAKWTLEDAATVPLAYLAAYYALFDKGRLEDGESVLIHDGAGAIGSAAVAVALPRGCKIFTTVGSEEQKRFVLNRFPELQEDQVINKFTHNFEEQVKRLTSGRGVDIVLTFSSQHLQACINCLKRNGRLVDLRTGESLKEDNIRTSVFSRNIEFCGIYFATLLEPKNQSRLKRAVGLFQEGIKNGTVKPLTRTVFTSDQIVEAIRYMEPNTHTGKVLVKISGEQADSKSRELTPTIFPAQPKLRFDPEKSVVVTGGLGGMGFELVLWLIERGVTKVIISSRGGFKNTYQRYWVERWQKEGLQVKLCHEDITTPAGCQAMLNEAIKLGPVGSIFHLAVVLRDGLLSKMTPQDYVDVCKVKVDATRYLDVYSRSLCPQLEHFVTASSIMSCKGVGGVGNYCYGNTALERVCEMRFNEGLPALAILWGAIGDAGIYYDEFGEDSTRHYDLRGSILLNMATCFTVMERYMMEKKPVLSFFARADETEDQAASRKDLLAVMGNILGISDTENLRGDTTLGSLGMDSLMVVEAKQLLETDYGTSLPIPQVLKLSIEDLKKISANSAKL